MEVIRRKEVHVNCVLDITHAGRKRERTRKLGGAEKKRVR